MFKNIKITYKILKDPPNLITYGLIDTDDYGQMFLAYYMENEALHICCLQFAVNNEMMESFGHNLHKLWKNSQFKHDDKLTKQVFQKYFKEKQEREVFVILNGTDFQMKVWTALLKIPYGEERTYGEVSEMIESPKAVRAVASAVANNNIAILIPCHRVKAKYGDLHKYRWGSELKMKILSNES